MAQLTELLDRICDSQPQAWDRGVELLARHYYLPGAVSAAFEMTGPAPAAAGVSCVDIHAVAAVKAWQDGEADRVIGDQELARVLYELADVPLVDASDEQLANAGVIFADLVGAGLRPVMAGLLLARHNPNLVPPLTKPVARALGLGQIGVEAWAQLRDLLRNTALAHQLFYLREAVGAPVSQVQLLCALVRAELAESKAQRRRLKAVARSRVQGQKLGAPGAGEGVPAAGADVPVDQGGGQPDFGLISTAAVKLPNERRARKYRGR